MPVPTNPQYWGRGLKPEHILSSFVKNLSDELGR
jgi:hypothetical protein